MPRHGVSHSCFVQARFELVAELQCYLMQFKMTDRGRIDNTCSDEYYDPKQGDSGMAKDEARNARMTIRK